MGLEQGHDAPAHVPRGGLIADGRSRTWERRRRGAPGHGEEPLVLLLGLMPHGGQACAMVVIGACAFFVDTRAFLGSLELCT